jgi:azurin
MRKNEVIFSIVLFFLASLLTIQREAGAFQAEDPPLTITLNAIAGLQFDLPRFHVRPGVKVKILLKNQDDMSHNLLFTRPGARLDVVNAAMKLEERGPEKNYIPDTPDVLWTIPVLSPGEERSVTFIVPKETGVYPYVCTFPGHGFSMYGAMYVTHAEQLPAVEKDVNIPPAARKKRNGSGDEGVKPHASHASKETAQHPYELKPPYLYRAYMEDASPAAIAVHLPHALSYCWDAGTCELRYAWEGGFVDNAGLWKGKPNAVAKVLGTVFFRNKIEQPLRIGDRNAPALAAYKGYQLIGGYPEFHYIINGIHVYELIQSKEDGNGFIRTFRIPEADKTVWFVAHPQDGMMYETSTGILKNHTIMLSPQQARNFRIIMTKKEKTK